MSEIKIDMTPRDCWFHLGLDIQVWCDAGGNMRRLARPKEMTVAAALKRLRAALPGRGEGVIVTVGEWTPDAEEPDFVVADVSFARKARPRPGGEAA